MTTAAARLPEEELARDLRESVSLAETTFAADKTVTLQVIRPCVGKGRGRHVYEAEMLRENAHKFSGWPMFVDHQAEAARRAAGGLPRSLRDQGGIILESWWDPSPPAEGDFGEGAVMARVKPTRFVRELIEDVPEAVRASINARATGVKPRDVGGRRAWVVEGIEDRGSVDWVTEDGAGGRVVSLMEAVYHAEKEEGMVLLEHMTDEEFAEYLRAERPELLEALGSGDGGGEPQRENTPVTTENQQTPAEALREALMTDEGRELLREVMAADLQPEVDLIRAQARADADRSIQLRDLKDEAHAAIREAKLPEEFEKELLRRYSLVEGYPTSDLDVVDEVDGDGNVTKPAGERLREAVTEAVKRQRELIEAAAPTRVEGQGAGDAETPAGESDKKKDSLWRSQLQEAGFEDPDKVFEAA